MDGPDDEGAVAALRRVRPRLDDLPLPGSGRTLERWRELADLARTDLSLARLAEGHADARAILLELDHPVPDGLLGVWAAQPDRLGAERHGSGWVLDGRKAWCSGATGLDAALITATTPEGPRLFVVDPSALGVVPGSWRPMGMVATRSETLVLDRVEVGADAAVGPPGAYVDRPGFGHGGCGVAACWWGGAVAVREGLRCAVARAEVDDVLPIALGEVTAALEGAWATLAVAARRIDDHPRAPADDLALVVRTAVGHAAQRTLDEVTRALGAAALCHDPVHAGRVADLTVYLSQLAPHRTSRALGDRAVDGTWVLAP